MGRAFFIVNIIKSTLLSRFLTFIITRKKHNFIFPLRPLLNGMSDENLVVEVWDFDPAETIGEKMSKFLDVKGVRGFRKLMKEIAITASTGKHDNEFIGKCSISLRVSEDQ